MKDIYLLGIAHNTIQTIDFICIIFVSPYGIFHTHLKSIAIVNILNPFCACCPSTGPG